jgi:glycosyltransferase involved in cell wall biosynthesis
MPREVWSSVSVVIPTYNRRAFICSAVESALDQSWPVMQIVVVDDGSTDGTSNLVRERIAGSWAGRSVTYVQQTNAGASAARNRGLSLSTGDYVQFLDSDDLLSKNKIARQVAELEKPENERAACCISFGRMGRSVDHAESRRISLVDADSRVLLRAFASTTTHVMQTTSPLWRRSFLVAQPGWAEDISLGTISSITPGYSPVCQRYVLSRTSCSSCVSTRHRD